MPSEVRARKSERQLYRLEQPFGYLSEKFGPFEAPVGLITDFASIPRIAWTYLDPEDPVILGPSVLHDSIYQYAGEMPDGRLLSRADADFVLREAMIACGARPAQALVVYQSVRLFGGSHWKPKPK